MAVSVSPDDHHPTVMITAVLVLFALCLLVATDASGHGE